MVDTVALRNEIRSPVKVPEVTAVFWIAKVLTTGLGETSSDFLVKTFEPLVVIPLTAALLVVALVIQWRGRSFSKWRYWLAVSLVAVFGTMAADALHVVVGVPYAVSTACFAFVLVLLFIAWYAGERTLSIHSISTGRREAFYWAAVIATFALGTAAGDLTASTLRLGYLVSGFLFLGLFALPLVLRRSRLLGEVGTFWAAYVVTRPLGASFADWIGVSHDRGGLGWGTGVVSLVLIALAALLVAREPFRPAAITPS